MKAGGWLIGGSIKRKYRVGASVYKGSALMYDTGQVGEVIMCSANSAANGAGIALEAVTYAATSPGQWVTTEASPFVIAQGDLWAGTTKVEFSPTYSSQVLLQDTASTTVLTDTAVGTLDYEGGLLISLSGASKGDVRVITTQTDATSTTVSVPFSASIAVNGYALRVYGPLTTGIELVGTYFDGWNNLITGTEAIGDAIGEWVVYDVFVDDQACAQVPHINIKNGTSPKVQLQCLFEDHAFNSVVVS
jgi:hypothetical protein